MIKELRIKQASVSKKEVKILKERINELSLPKSKANICKWLMFTIFALLFFFIFFYTVTTLCSYSDCVKFSDLILFIIYFGILYVIVFAAFCLAWVTFAIPKIDKKHMIAKQNQQKLLQSAQGLTDLIALQESLKYELTLGKDRQACVTTDHIYFIESKGSVLVVLKEFELPSGIFNVEDPYNLDFSISDNKYQELNEKVDSLDK